MSKKKITPQNFRIAISIGILSIFLSFKGIGKSESVSEFYSILADIADIFIWLVFRKYLNNFSAKEAIKWVDWSIVMQVCFLAVQSLLLLFSNNEDLEMGISIFGLAILVFAVYVWIKTGLAIKSIENDFVGLLKELGFCILIIIPLILLLSVAYMAKEDILFEYAIFVLGSIETVIMMMVFNKANSYKSEIYNSK